MMPAQIAAAKNRADVYVNWADNYFSHPTEQRGGVMESPVILAVIVVLKYSFFRFEKGNFLEG
jgi:hypothetical protein